MFTTSIPALRRSDRLRPPRPLSHFRRRSQLRSCPLSPLPPMAARVARCRQVRPRPPPMAG
eukprot:13811437-Alexandrium_andersonii.AAC.1